MLHTLSALVKII